MAANQKVERLIDSLVNQLTMRGLTVTKSYFTGGTAGTGMGAFASDAWLLVQGSTSLSPTGAAATTLATKAEIIIKPVSGLYGQLGGSETDGLGLPQRVYNPLVAQVVFNSDTATNGASQAALISTKGYEALIMGELLKTGCNIEVYNFLKTTPGLITTTDWASATLSATIVQDAFYPYAGQ
jgi:hypothetical protein